MTAQIMLLEENMHHQKKAVLLFWCPVMLRETDKKSSDLMGPLSHNVDFLFCGFESVTGSTSLLLDCDHSLY